MVDALQKEADGIEIASNEIILEIEKNQNKKVKQTGFMLLVKKIS